MATHLPEVIPGGDDLWWVASNSAEGAYYMVTHSGIGLFACTCKWSRHSGVAFNNKPCSHLKKLHGYLYHWSKEKAV
jgi:hypothetical protein